MSPDCGFGTTTISAPLAGTLLQSPQKYEMQFPGQTSIPVQNFSQIRLEQAACFNEVI